MNCTKIVASIAKAATCGALALIVGCGGDDATATDGAAGEANGAAPDGIAECDPETGVCPIPADVAATDAADSEEAAGDEISLPLSGDDADAEPDLPPETVLATVGGKTLTVAGADEELLKMFGGNVSIEQLRPVLRNMRPQVVMNFVAKALVENEIAARGVDASDAEIDAEIEKILKANPLPEGLTLEEIITRQGGTMADFRENVGMKVKVEKLVDAPSNAAMADFYAAHKEEFETPPSASARHILIMVDKDGTPEQKAEKKAKAEELLAKIREGADFAELAKEHSDCPSKERGGDLGKFGRGAMVPEFEKAVFERPVGEVGDIVETDYGYHIIEVTERDEGGMPPFDELKDRISSILRGQAINELIDNLRKNAKIEFHESIADLFADEPEKDGEAESTGEAAEAVEAVTEAATEAAAEVQAEAAEAVEAATEAAAEVATEVQAEAAEAVEAVTEAATEPAAEVQAEAAEAVEAVADGAAQVLDAVKDAADDAAKTE